MTASPSAAPVFTKSVDLPVTPDEAFALITQPERLRRWKTVAATVDLRAGGAYRWTVTPDTLPSAPSARSSPASGSSTAGVGRAARTSSPMPPP